MKATMAVSPHRRLPTPVGKPILEVLAQGGIGIADDEHFFQLFACRCHGP
ncbi:MAG TPA: hypothetical protein VEL76_30070 [Gemmataceae bacterium]|nr:hypothetical protein [Gemmataceae bacterium]